MLILNGKLVTWEQPNRILEGQAVLLSGELIQEIGPQDELLQRHPDVERLDARGQFVMPGSICAHTHFYGAYARGMPIPGLPPKDFPDILRKLWWPLDRALDLDSVRASAQVMLLDAIRHGATTLIDHHASPNAIAGSLDAIAEEIERAGVRGALCYEVTDRDGPAKAQAGIIENLRFFDYLAKRKPRSTRLAATFGLHASLTLSDDTLEACRMAAPEEAVFHIHVAEHEADQYDSLAKSGMRVVDRLHSHGILRKGSILVHAVHVDAREIGLLAESGVWLTHQPRSNMNNGVGVSQVESFLRAGVPVCLGTDGFPSTLWEEWKTTYLLQKAWHRDPRRMSAADIARMAIYNNAALAGQLFPHAPIGVLAPSACADLIFVDYPAFTPVTPENLPWHIVFGFHESMVTTTIAAGKALMVDRRLLTLDEAAILARARELAPGVWERYASNVPAD